jgi:hypothetical protein
MFVRSLGDLISHRAGGLAVVRRAVGRISCCAIVLVLFSTWNPTAIAAPVADGGQDRPPQAPSATPVTGNEDAQSTAEAGDDQQPPAPPGPQGDAAVQQTPTQTAAPSAPKKGEWLLAPIPISSPAIGSGLEWAVARIFPFHKKDEVSPPSSVGLGGVFTNNGSRAVAFGGRLYLKEDRFRVAAGIAKASVNFDVYGVGEASGKQGVFVPLNVDGVAGIGEFLFRLTKGIYVGARGQYRNATLSQNNGSSDAATEPPEKIANILDQLEGTLLHQTTVSLGPRFQWDTRDNVFYPKHGFLAEVASDLFSTGLGSKWSYQYYRASFNKYTALSEHQVLAFRAMGCAAAGDRVPIYDLCLYGTANDLRGYPGGRYQDRRMFATQLEYRLMFPSRGFLGRFGVVAFAGVGAVGSKFTDIGFNDLLPAAGAGGRFRLLKKYPINFRVDYGVGKGTHTLSIGVLEAF